MSIERLVVKLELLGNIFSWDARNEKMTVQVRKIAFTEASLVFFDPHAIDSRGPYLRNGETQRNMIGSSLVRRELLVVSHIALNDEIFIVDVWPATDGDKGIYYRQFVRPPVAEA